MLIARAALLAAVVLITLVLVGLARAEPQSTTRSTFRDNLGREVGTATTQGSTTTFRDSLGRETGRATKDKNGTTFYDASGREIGRAGRGR